MLEDAPDSPLSLGHTVHPLWDEAKRALDEAHATLNRASAGRGFVPLQEALDNHVRALNRYSAITDAVVACARNDDPETAGAVILSTVFRARSDEVPETIGLSRALARALHVWTSGLPNMLHDRAVRDTWESVEMALRRRGRRL